MILTLEDYERELSEIPAFARRLLDDVAQHEPTTYRHLIEVGFLSYELAIGTSVTPTRARVISLAGLLHDVGKLDVDPDILIAPRTLTAQEWELMRLHPGSGAQRCREYGEPGLARMIEDHHERIDGRGYPAGKRGRAIPVEARIIAVADAYDVLTRGRPYKEAVRPSDALGVLENQPTPLFDPEIVQALGCIVHRKQLVA